jgi:DNA polymerase (family 10)
VKNKELAEIFSRIADALEFQGENMFKIIAYRKASRILNDLTEDIETMDKNGTISDLPGIGKAIAEKIHEYLAMGKMKKYEDVKRAIPGELLDMLSIQNLGPRTLALAYNALGVATLKDLKKAIRNGKLAELPGMGTKKVENISKGITLYEQSQARMSIAQATSIAENIVSYMKQQTKITAITPAGSLRRCRETIGDIDILIASNRAGPVIKAFMGYPQIERVLASGETKSSIMVKGGIQVDLRVVPVGSYGAALQYFTGSKAHNVRLRNIAKDFNMKLNEYGLFKGKKLIAGKSEKEIYQALGLKFMPPELREDRGEIEAARSGTLPRLITNKHLRGDLQMHSTYSDSKATIEDLARAAQELGYEYILITDHSQSAHYAHGVEPKRLSKQWKEVDALNRKLKKITILKGAEVDIKSDGSLDYPNSILKRFDLVLAAIHQGFMRNVTERICAAMENPYVDIIAHPTGRLISQREGYRIDIRAIMDKAVATGTWLELNAFPDRLDLNDVHCKMAKDMGIRISLGTDAHSVDGLAWMRFGIATARRGWLEPKDVVNTYPLKKLLAIRKSRTH